jgi:hypothetical protein
LPASKRSKRPDHEDIRGGAGGVPVSHTQGNPYKVGQRERYIDSGLYCERVIRRREMLLVPDAAVSAEWKNNPDMKIGMKCYLGLPIKLPNGNCFGTICVLDDKRNDFSEDMIEIMKKMRDLIESNLLLFHFSITDPLTGLYKPYILQCEDRDGDKKRGAEKAADLGHAAGHRPL